jgi:hypothetical protein
MWTSCVNTFEAATRRLAIGRVCPVYSDFFAADFASGLIAIVRSANGWECLCCPPNKRLEDKRDEPFGGLFPLSSRLWGSPHLVQTPKECFSLACLWATDKVEFLHKVIPPCALLALASRTRRQRHDAKLLSRHSFRNEGSQQGQPQ